MSGIPPLAGFFAKFSVIFSLVNNSNLGLAFIVILSSMVGAFYYLRWVKIMYSDNYNFNKANEYITFSLDNFSSIIFMVFSIFIMLYFLDPYVVNVYCTVLSKYIFI
jgi:NADH-quinone oxidoreductase subunit N